MDDFGNHLMADYSVTDKNPNPPAFNWSAYVYFLHPEHWYDTEKEVYGRGY